VAINIEIAYINYIDDHPNTLTAGLRYIRTWKSA